MRKSRSNVRLPEQASLNHKNTSFVTILEKAYMKFTKRMLAGSVAASALAVSSFTSTAYAEVSASVGIATTYLFRGYDLGSGTPAVSGDLTYSNSGFYTGAWASSGDTEAGTEYDLYAGYGRSFGENDMFSVDLSVWNYIYPTGPGLTDNPNAADITGETDFGDWTEVALSVGVGPVAFTYYDNISGNAGYEYYTLSGTVAAFSLTVGMHDNPEGDDPVHVNLGYAYSDNLAFTLSQFVTDEPEGDDLKFVVSYSLPIGE